MSDTRIRIKTTTYNRLASLKGESETYDDLINSLLLLVSDDNTRNIYKK